MKKLTLCLFAVFGLCQIAEAQTIRAKNINNDRRCDMFAGADASAKVIACANDLPATGGKADANGITGAVTWSSDPFVGIGSRPVDFWCNASTITIMAPVFIPETVTIHPGTGCVFDGAFTLTINGKIDNPHNSQMFTTMLPLVLNGMSDSPDWFGAIADGDTLSPTDNSAAIQAAIAAFSGKVNPYGSSIGPASGGWGTMRFDSGVYLYRSGATIDKSGVHLRGAGHSSTILRFQPASGPATAISFNAGEELHDLSIEDLTLDATGSDLSVVKRALYLYDVAEVSIRNFYIRDFSDSTHASQCVEIHGREHVIVENVSWFCNRPLFIGADPETMTEGLDRSMFHNVLLGALTSIAEGITAVTDKPVVEISEADALLADVTFDGFDFLGGSYSFYWSNTNSKVGSYDVTFKNGRNEGSIPNWAFYINPPTGNQVQNLTFDTVTLHGGDKGGWFLRNVPNGSMNSVTYAAASSIAPVDADATAAMSFSNVNWNLHSSLNNALNGWCGTRFNEDSGASVKSSGNFVLRTCSAPDIILESIPAGTTHSISAASCVGNLLTYTIGSNSFGANGQIRVTGVSPSGLNGTYSVVSATSTTVSVVNDACPLTYSSGGTNALVYGPPSFISTASVLSDGAVGDLQLRSDGGKIAQGFAGKTMSAWLPGYLQFYDLAGTTPKAYIGSAASVGSNWTTDDLQIRSDGTAIRFSFNGTEAQYMPNPGGLVFDSGVTTPTGGAGTVGLGATTQSAGTGNCPTTVTINGSASAPAGCLVITVGGTGRSVPFF